MVNTLRNYLSSMPKSAKTLVNQLNFLYKVIKRCNKKSKSKRVFSGFDGLKSSFGSMEMSNQIELVFKFIDANGDGKISPLELSDFLLCLGHDKSKAAEEAQGMLRHLDSNGDGFVDLNEYKDAVLMGSSSSSSDDDDHHHHHDHDEGHDHDGDIDDGLENDLMDVFLVFDSDNNGLISAKELQQVLKSLGFAKCGLKECNLMIKGVDKDGDGFVNYDEFKLMMLGYVG